MKIQDAILYGSKRGSGSGPTPSGSIEISENGTYDVTAKAEAVVSVPQPSGTKQVTISQNGTTTEDVEDYENAQITVNVQPNLTTKTITQNGTYQASGDNADGYSSVVVNTPSAPLEPGEVNFYDYDGTLLYVMTIAQARALQSLPPLPDHSQDEVPLTDAEWNWTLEELHDLQIPMDIAATYNVVDEYFHYIVDLPENALTVTLYNGTTSYIDFGDGEAGYYYNKQYTYNSPGRKHIKTNKPSVIRVYDTTTKTINYENVPGDFYAVKRIYYPVYSTTLTNHCRDLKGLEAILISKGADARYFMRDFCIKFIGIPRGNNILPYVYNADIISTPGNLVLTDTYYYVSVNKRLCLKLNNTEDYTLILQQNRDNYPVCNELYIQTQSKVNLSIPTVTKKIHVKGPMTINWQNCYYLDCVDISSASGVMREKAFYNNLCLSSIVVPNGITEIGAYAFSVSKLSFIDIPSTVTSIGDMAFGSSCYMQRMICRATTPPTLGSGVYSSTFKEVYVPDESVEDYKAATNWSVLKSIIYPLSEIEGE